MVKVTKKTQLMKGNRVGQSGTAVEVAESKYFDSTFKFLIELKLSRNVRFGIIAFEFIWFVIFISILTSGKSTNF
jgi:hypothetical protein